MEIALCHPTPKAFRYGKEMGCEKGYLDLSWAMIQPEPEIFDFSYYDPIVEEASSLGVELVGMVSSQRGIEYFPDGHWIWRNHRGMMPDKEAWSRFLERVVDRYHGTIRYWEIWSEPNCLACNPMSYYDPQLCRDVVETASGVIRKKDSTAQIVLSGLWLRTLEANYVKELLNGGETEKYFDIFSWHFFLMTSERRNIPFELWKPPLGRWVEFFRSQLSKECPMWITEFGVPTEATDSDMLYSRTGGPVVGLSEEEQADWVGRFTEAAESEWGIDLLVWLMLEDEEDPDHYYVHNTGLLRCDGSPKPVRDKLARIQADKAGCTTAVTGGK